MALVSSCLHSTEAPCFFRCHWLMVMVPFYLMNGLWLNGIHCSCCQITTMNCSRWLLQLRYWAIARPPSIWRIYSEKHFDHTVNLTIADVEMDLSCYPTPSPPLKKKLSSMHQELIEDSPFPPRVVRQSLRFVTLIQKD